MANERPSFLSLIASPAAVSLAVVLIGLVAIDIYLTSTGYDASHRRGDRILTGQADVLARLDRIERNQALVLSALAKRQ